MVKIEYPPPQWEDKGAYKEPTNSDNIRVPRLEVDDATTYIDKDGSDNMTLTDAVTGTKTLAELSGSGDVTGPGSSTDNAIARFDGTGGKTLQDSGVTINDTNDVFGMRQILLSTSGFGIKGLEFNNAFHGIFAMDNDVGLAEIARLVGAADPYFSMGGSQQFKFYNSGYAYLTGYAYLGDNWIWATYPGQNNHFTFQAFNEGASNVEVARVQSAVDSYFAMGGSQQFKFKNSGVADLGNGALTNVNIDSGDIAAGVTINVKLDDFAAPDDNTDLDFSTSAHGLTPKGTNVGNFLKDDGTWAAPAGGGDVTGPGSSTDNAIARFHSTTGKVIQDYTSNPPTISDTGDITVDGDLTADNLVTAGNVDGVDVSALDSAVVKKADFNAQTVLAATSDDTPAALTVGEQTVVGRITGGNVVALTVAQLQTLVLSTALPENSNIEWDNALSADGKWSGIVTKQFNGGATIPFGEVVYLKAADSEWYQAKADATATSGAVMVGICVLATTDGNACTVLLQGKVRADAKFPTFTISAPVFISAATAGLLTSTAPTGTTNFVVRIVGHAGTGDELYFNPDNSYVELA